MREKLLSIGDLRCEPALERRDHQWLEAGARQGAVDEPQRRLVLECIRDRLLELGRCGDLRGGALRNRCLASERANESVSGPASARSTVRSISGAASSSPAATSSRSRPLARDSGPPEDTASPARRSTGPTTGARAARHTGRSASRPAATPARAPVASSPRVMSCAVVARAMPRGSQRRGLEGKIALVAAQTGMMRDPVSRAKPIERKQPARRASAGG
jgi:hypothetical protein